jgi:hypothetical protein
MLAVVAEQFDKEERVTLVVRDEDRRELYRASLNLAGRWAMDAQGRAIPALN